MSTDPPVFAHRQPMKIKRRKRVDEEGDVTGVAGWKGPEVGVGMRRQRRGRSCRSWRRPFRGPRDKYPSPALCASRWRNQHAPNCMSMKLTKSKGISVQSLDHATAVASECFDSSNLISHQERDIGNPIPLTIHDNNKLPDPNDVNKRAPKEAFTGW